MLWGWGPHRTTSAGPTPQTKPEARELSECQGEYGRGVEVTESRIFELFILKKIFLY